MPSKKNQCMSLAAMSAQCQLPLLLLIYLNLNFLIAERVYLHSFLKQIPLCSLAKPDLSIARGSGCKPFVLAAEIWVFLTGWNGMKKSKMEWNSECTQLHVTGAAQSRSNYLVYLQGCYFTMHRGFMNKSALSNCSYVSKHGTEASSSSDISYGSYEKMSYGMSIPTLSTWSQMEIDKLGTDQVEVESGKIYHSIYFWV